MEVRENMPLRKPTEDFLRGSIHPLVGKFVRLCYFSEVRDSESEYQHWGLERTYGEAAAKKAMAEAHSLVWADLMQSTIQDLEVDFRASLDESQRSELTHNVRLIPHNDCGALPRHFHFLVQTINQLLRR